MAKGRDRIVFQRSDGLYVNKRNDASRASSVHKKQGQAVNAAHSMLENQGGGELSIKAVRGDKAGKIRSKDTVAPGNDPNPPRDTEH